MIKILVLALSLLIPSAGYACWDDYEDDWWSDDSWWDDDDYDDSWDDWDSWDDDDDDVAWDEELPDLVVTPDEDYDWGLDDDWWQNDQWDDDNYDDSDYDDPQGEWGGDGDSGIGDHQNDKNVSEKGKSEPYKIKDTDKVVDNLPDTWKRQNTNMNCVSTALEFVSRILFGEGCFDRSLFENKYKEMFGKDLTVKGVDSDKLFDLVKVYFTAENVTGYDEYKEAIENGAPVMSTVSGTNEKTEHEVVVVGLVGDESKEGVEKQVIVYDPGYGDYRSMSFDNIKENSGIEVTGFNLKSNIIKKYKLLSL